MEVRLGERLFGVITLPLLL